jgi:alanine racemase
MPVSALNWVDVDLAAVRANVRALRTRAGPAEFAAVVKADGYGLGAAAIGRAALEAGAGRLCVFALDEAQALREAGIDAPILVLGPLRAEDAARVARLGVACTLTRAELVAPLARAAAAGRPIAVHVKVDMGMHRLGAPAAAAEALVAAVRAEPGLRLDGFYTHFPSADGPGEAGRDDTEHRFARFLALADRTSAPRRHAANSATLLRFPQMALDLVRVGAGVYGFGPGAAAAPAAALLRPVAAWRARLVQLHDLAPGESVSYGGTWTASRAARVGVVAVGYADGFRHALSNRGAMIVRGRRVPVVGAVCMDMTLVDLSDVPAAAVGDTATLIGRDGEAESSLQAFAERCGTIPYEVLTGLGPRPERRYIDAAESDRG